MPIGVGVPLNLPRRSNVLAMWSFEGNFNDRSGQGYHVQNATVLSTSAGGKIGIFDNEQGGGWTPTGKNFFSGTGDFTWCCWYRSGNNGGPTGLFSMGEQTAYVEKNVFNSMYFSGGGGSLALGFGYDNVWRHGAIVRLSGAGTSYTNAGVSATGSIAGSIASGRATVWYGSAGYEGWGHECDEMIFWNVALTAGEISTVYNLTSYVDPPLDSGVIYF